MLGETKMKTKRSCLARVLACGLAISLAAPMAPAWAGPADDLRDLVGARGASGESALETRGYTHVDTAKSRDAAFGYWWSNAKRACVRVTTRDGRYEALTDVDASDCGQTRRDGGVSDGAKVAMAAAAILGVTALAHKSHHRDDRNYDERQTADFERGYRDGLYNHAYHNYDSSREYGDGYSRGVEERGRESSYRNNSYDRGGYQSYAHLGDLAGRGTGHAWREMARRGFEEAGRRDLGPDRGNNYFWNGQTGQCVDVFVRQGKVESVSEVRRHACDR